MDVKLKTPKKILLINIFGIGDVLFTTPLISNLKQKFPDSRKLANVSNLPTFASFKDGLLVEEAQGNKIETIEHVLDAITSN